MWWLPTREDDEHRELLVRAEAMIGAGRHEDGVPYRDRVLGAFDLEHAAPLEHEVDLVVVVRLLPVRLRRDEHVDADLKPRALVDDFVAAAGLLQAALDG